MIEEGCHMCHVFTFRTLRACAHTRAQTSETRGCGTCGTPLQHEEHPAQPEAALQRAVLAHLEARAVPGAFWFSPPKGGARTRVEGAILKSLGVRPGVLDLTLFHDGRHDGLELKAAGGQLSPAQRATIARMERAGAFFCMGKGLDRALAALEPWGLLRGRTAGADKCDSR
jgi:hypothetical protein